MVRGRGSEELGVDFVLQAARLLSRRRFEEVSGEGLRFSQRVYPLNELLLPEFEGRTLGRILRDLLPRPVSLTWFVDAYMGYMAGGRDPDERDLWPPEVVRTDMEAVRDALRDRGEAFPRYFAFREDPGGREVGGGPLVLDGRAYVIRGGWDECRADPLETEVGAPPGTQPLDLRTAARLPGRRIGFSRRPDGTYGDVLGPPVTLTVENGSAYDRYRSDLEAILALCDRCSARGLRIFTYIS